MKETHQARVYREQLEESATIRTAIESERGTVSASYNNGRAGVTVVDMQLRRAHSLMDIEAIDKLIEELKIMRAHLVYESMLAELPRLKVVV